MKIRRRAGKMSVAVEPVGVTRERLLAKARKLSERVTKRTIEAGITTEQLERDAREALRHVQRTYRTGSH